MAPLVLVVGSGIAGLMAVYEAGKSGARVLLLDKEPHGGGNSIKASSGLSAARNQEDVEAFYSDVMTGGGGSPFLVRKLTEESPDVLKELEAMRLPLSRVTRLGGHSFARTFAPEGSTPVGLYLYGGLESLVRRTMLNHSLEVRYRHRLIEVVRNEANGRVEGGLFAKAASGSNDGGEEEVLIRCDAIVLATGGFGGSEEAYRLFSEGQAMPHFATSNGGQANGDGLLVAMNIGAALCDISRVQLHPTGFVDPENEHSASKVICPESWRGAGAVLVDPASGRRFVDELGRRDEVAAAIAALPGGEALLIIPPSAARAIHGLHDNGYYASRGLVKKVALTDLPQAFAESLGAGHSRRPADDCNAHGGEYWTARVVPVVHYCLGGLAVNDKAQVLDSHGGTIPGFFAAGEVTGGVHGKNRLGGNSILDCFVFGKTAGYEAAKWAADLRNDTSK